MYSQSLGQWNKLPPTVSHIRPDFPEPYESPSDGLRGKNEYFTQSGKLAQNAFIESFNRTYRTKILGFCLFRTLDEKRELAANWLSEYNSERHINYLTI
ncbi:hypothetical protein DS959_26270 [Escherichia coli]|nr:hypothetical protein DS959_26270 [Escherichia coli]